MYRSNSFCGVENVTETLAINGTILPFGFVKIVDLLKRHQLNSLCAQTRTDPSTITLNMKSKRTRTFSDGGRPDSGGSSASAGT